MSMNVTGIDDLADTFRDLKTRYADGVVYVTGTNVEYSVYLETGTENMEPYPFLFPAMRDVARSWEKYGDSDDIDSTEALVKAVAFDIEAQAKKNVRAATAAGRSPGTHPAHPEVQIGNLIGSIRTERVK